MVDSPRRDVVLSALGRVPYWIGYAIVAVRAGWRWCRESFRIGCDTARKRWPHAG